MRSIGGAAASKQRGLLEGAELTVATRLLVGALLLLLFRAADYVLFRQDLPAIALTICALFASSRWPRSFGAMPPLGAVERVPWLVLAAVFAIALAGTWLVFGDYALSRDEILANFDADFLRTGRLVAPVPAEWRPFATAMMPLFMLPVPNDAGWISAYLPGNAALRALAGLALGKEYASPALAALAAFALYRIARRLWPEDSRTATAVLLLLAASPQLLVTAMTPFAMTAHLAFNLLWLWCYLRDDPPGDGAALAIGLVATGLHQIVFHPIFVAPFLLELLLARRWGRLTVFTAGYALIGLFWASYWQIVLSSADIGVPASQAAASGLPYLIKRLAEMVTSFNLTSVVVMLFNLVRFAAWQHLLLLPLALLAWPVIRRAKGIARPLAGGIALMLATVLILLPWQGNGWGYRYLHGFLGSFCLLAGYGWRRIAANAGERPPDAALVVATAFTLAVILPIHLYNAHEYVKPYRDAYAMIAASSADVVLVDPTGLEFAQDLVRNAPDGSNRPKVMDVRLLDEALVRSLCSRYALALFDRRHALLLGIREGAAEPPPPQRALLDRLQCAPPLTLRRAS